MNLLNKVRVGIVQLFRYRYRSFTCACMLAGTALGGVGGVGGCKGPGMALSDKGDGYPAAVADLVIASPPGMTRPPFRFTKADDQLLDEVQRAAFLFLWKACDPRSGMVVDRSSVKFASTAGVGFQLAALPIGVERGWVTKDEACARAIMILSALEGNPNNRKAGLFYHFLDGATAGPIDQDVVSTVDSALLFAGMLTAGSYFGGEARERADRLFDQADWTFFAENNPRPHEHHLKGFISLGWKPADFKNPTGEGSLLPYYWADSGDEHRLVCLLAGAASNPAHRVDPLLYYRLRRQIGEFQDTGPMVYFPWSGALFTNFFAHCFINYAAMGPDDPAGHGVARRANVDWWENSRRAVLLHRRKAEGRASQSPNFGPNAWGLTASDAVTGYAVPGVFPDPLKFTDMRPELDYSTYVPQDNFGDGTIAPYGAGSSVMFDPVAAIAALRHYRSLKGPDGRPLIWRDPSEGKGMYGFQDAVNVATGWVAPDCVAIDQGPLVLAIENARSGLVWKLFDKHPAIREAMERLGMKGFRTFGDSSGGQSTE